ncbi:transposase [Streptomyces griseoloalbus]|uniref:Transposase IS4-like domain-containing protein n=1 Tax=Streptomyces griseoloalbus TaxID=67303 RepID=A0A7W8F6R6_9ACTN|nr:transposase [Streptomyces albaduncus]MBB5125238.1 hypothetical protein [Streptomyces albaduncus]GGW29095.1 hypothetical protein GCM10010340_03420 [Streptomyces albaduncus]
MVAIDGTTLNVPDEPAVTWHYPKHVGPMREFGYPIVRLVTLVECGTRALIDAVFGPDRTGENSYAHRLLGSLDGSMLLLADAYDAVGFLTAVSDTGAAFLLRSTRKRRPTVRHPLPDGSYRTFIQSNNHRAGRGYGQRLEVRVIEAWVTVTLADGTRRTELSPRQVSFTILLQAAADQIAAGNGTTVTEPVTPVGAMGHVVLANLVPEQRRWRMKSRMLKRYDNSSDQG